MLWIVILRYIILRGWVVVFAVPFEEFWQRFWCVWVLDRELDGIVDFLARTDAFEWFGGIWVNKAVENLTHRFVIE